MTKFTLLALGALVALSACAPITSPSQPGPDGQPVPAASMIDAREAQAIPARVLQQINTLRGNIAAPAMRMNPQLTAAALGLGILGGAAIGAALLTVGTRIWPDFRFDAAVVIPAVVACAAVCASAVIGVQLNLRGHHVAASTNTAIGAAVLVPAAVLGYVLSRYANRVLTPARQRWTAIAASTAGAVVLVVQQTGLL